MLPILERRRIIQLPQAPCSILQHQIFYLICTYNQGFLSQKFITDQDILYILPSLFQMDKIPADTEEGRKERSYLALSHNPRISHEARVESAKAYVDLHKKRTGTISPHSGVQLNPSDIFCIGDKKSETYWTGTITTSKVSSKEEKQPEEKQPEVIVTVEPLYKRKHKYSHLSKAGEISGIADTHEGRVEAALLAAAHNPRLSHDSRVHCAQKLSDMQLKRLGVAFDPEEEAKIGDLIAKDLGYEEFTRKKHEKRF